MKARTTVSAAMIVGALGCTREPARVVPAQPAAAPQAGQPATAPKPSPEPFDGFAAGRLSASERTAFGRCASDWTADHSPDEAGRICACFMRGLQKISGGERVDQKYLRSWPPRQSSALTVFMTCVQYAADMAEADCASRAKAEGMNPELACCGSGGCTKDFAMSAAAATGYLGTPD